MRITPEERIAAAEAYLKGRIARTRWGMVAEQFIRAFWPLWTLVLIVASLVAFGAAQALGALLLPVSALVLVLAGGIAWRGLQNFTMPTQKDAEARIDRSLKGRPLSAMRDQIAVGKDNAASQSIWARHLENMANAAAGAKAARPDLRLAARDPGGLRLVALIFAIAAGLFARGVDTTAFTDALQADAAPLELATGPSFEAWAMPPAYTGKPTLYLAEVRANGPIDLPTGTQITVRAYGEGEAFSLDETVSGGVSALGEAAVGIQNAEVVAVQDGHVTILEGSDTLGSWAFAVIPDAVPVIDLAEPVKRAVTGAMELTYTAQDDYGITGGWVEIALDLDGMDRRYGLAAVPVPREGIALDLPMPFAGGTEDITETLVEDFSKHPWAGLPVRITLGATDAADQTGTITGLEAVLPGRKFFDPVAGALVELRRDLLWSPENGARVNQLLRAITHAPEDMFEGEDGAYLMIRTAIRRMGYMSEDGLDAAEIDDLAEMLWQAALLLEEGSLSDAAERLRQARERLSEAIENGATEEELAELMAELREAMNEYMQQLAQQQMENGEMEQARNEDGVEITDDMLQQMMDRIEELFAEGREAEAQELLNQLMEMMENMRMMAQQGGGEGQQQGAQTMQELQDTLRQQQDLADEAFRDLQEQFQQNRGQPQQGQQGQGQPQNQPGQQQGQQEGGQQQPGQGQQGQQGQQQGQGSQPGGNSPGALAQRQEALRELLNNLRGQLPGASTEEGDAAREALREAERNMGEARDALEGDNVPEALDRQADAMDKLREGMQGLGEEMQQQAQQGQGQGGDQTSQGNGRENNDPLGRPQQGVEGNPNSNENLLGGVDPFARSRELFDEIRRRSSEQGRDSEELDYLKRLLDRF